MTKMNLQEKKKLYEMESIYDIKTTVGRLKYWAEKQPDEEAFVFVTRDGLRTALTCKEIYVMSKTFGSRLNKLGVKAGDVVCSLVSDSPEGYVAYFGIHFAGCTVQNPSTQLADGRFLLDCLNTTKCKAVIVSSRSNDTARKILYQNVDSVSGNLVSSTTLPHLKYVIFTRDVRDSEKIGFEWTEELEDVQGSSNHVDVKETDIAVLAITSGTTGTSKLVECSQAYVTNFSNRLSEVYRGEIKGHTFFAAYNLYWIVGTPGWFLTLGIRNVVLDKRNPIPDEEYYMAVKEAIEKENCTIATMTAFGLSAVNDLIAKSGPHPVWPLQASFIGGQPLRKHIQHFVGTVAHRIYNMYGCTETGLICSKEITVYSKFADFNAGSIGRFVQVKIVNENLKLVPQGMYGQILVKSLHPFSGYVGDKEKAKALFTADGYICTNDYGCINSDGEVVVQGRVGEVISRGQNYFHPSWIEVIVAECSGVLDVMIVKVPDALLHHEICACIVAKDGSGLTGETVQDYCNNIFLKNHPDGKSACPKYYLVIQSIPLNRNGKKDRLALEKYAIENLKL